MTGAGVDSLVAKHDLSRLQKSGCKSRICLISAWKEEAFVVSEVFGNGPFCLRCCQILSSGKAGGRCRDSVFMEALSGDMPPLPVCGKSQIVVGREVDEWFSVDGDDRTRSEGVGPKGRAAQSSETGFLDPGFEGAAKCQDVMRHWKIFL